MTPKERVAEWRKAQREKYGTTTAVYYIPSIHYAGIANLATLAERISKHKHYGVDISGWKIMNVYKTRVEARHYENLLHSLMGMNGINGSS